MRRPSGARQVNSRNASPENRASTKKDGTVATTRITSRRTEKVASTTA